ncbi:MAG: rhodanese-like domain-containing protein [Spirochaetota bacterium]|nr:MAG: rhodanese-like domain-containing protein [Spirochaetota bacterium]
MKVSLFALIILIASSSIAQDTFINEIEFSPYIAMPESLLYKLINKDTDFIIYDVRAPESFKRGHISGAVNIPWEKWDALSIDADIPKDKIVVLVSEDGEESFSALKYLLEKGYSELWVIEGGMQNWMYKDWISRGE